jgi:quercetin dioxygenase-like cupin family protein
MRPLGILRAFAVVTMFLPALAAPPPPAAPAAPAAPISMDPAVVNAKTIKVKMENARVRVLEAVLQPGEKEQLHSHPAYVIYVIAGGKTRNHMADGETKDVEMVTGDVIYREPLTHWAENIGTTTIRLILVELKGPA